MQDLKRMPALAAYLMLDFKRGTEVSRSPSIASEFPWEQLNGVHGLLNGLEPDFTVEQAGRSQNILGVRSLSHYHGARHAPAFLLQLILVSRLPLWPRGIVQAVGAGLRRGQ